MMSLDQEHKFNPVAVFWDYENCHPTSNSIGGFAVVENIRRTALQFGTIVLFKAYFELSDSSSFKSLSLRSELQSSGVSLTDCPHNGRKDVADKMMLVDMLAFAIDNPAPATVVLITGDRDFAYSLSILRMRRYKVILIAPPTNVHMSLTAQASSIYDWQNFNLPSDDSGLAPTQDSFGVIGTPILSGSKPLRPLTPQSPKTARQSQDSTFRKSDPSKIIPTNSGVAVNPRSRSDNIGTLSSTPTAQPFRLTNLSPTSSWCRPTITPPHAFSVAEQSRSPVLPPLREPCGVDPNIVHSVAPTHDRKDYCNIPSSPRSDNTGEIDVHTTRNRTSVSENPSPPPRRGDLVNMSVLQQDKSFAQLLRLEAEQNAAQGRDAGLQDESLSLNTPESISYPPFISLNLEAQTKAKLSVSASTSLPRSPTNVESNYNPPNHGNLGISINASPSRSTRPLSGGVILSQILSARPVPDDLHIKDSPAFVKTAPAPSAPVESDHMSPPTPIMVTSSARGSGPGGDCQDFKQTSLGLANPFSVSDCCVPPDALPVEDVIQPLPSVSSPFTSFAKLDSVVPSQGSPVIKGLSPIRPPSTDPTSLQKATQGSFLSSDFGSSNSTPLQFPPHPDPGPPHVPMHVTFSAGNSSASPPPAILTAGLGSGSTKPVTAPTPSTSTATSVGQKTTVSNSPSKPRSLASIPQKFRQLVQTLEQWRLDGESRPSRSKLAVHLLQIDQLIYEHAGVERFKQYAALAEKAGFVQLGRTGQGGGEWICLHPNWHGLILQTHAAHLRTGAPSKTSVDSSSSSKVAPRASASTSSKSPASHATLYDINQAQIPQEFLPLVNALKEWRLKGEKRTLQSKLGQQLANPIYKEAGVTQFKEYIVMAEKFGLVQLGSEGKPGTEWVSLRPKWHE